MESGTRIFESSGEPQRHGRRRALPFIASLLVGVGIGWWLAPKCSLCPQPSTGNGAAGAAGRAIGGGSDQGAAGSGAPGAGSQMQVASGDAATDGMHQSAGAKPPDADIQRTDGAVAGGGRKLIDRSDPPPEQPGTSDLVRTATDFTYDHTDLPRYPDSVTGVFSAASVTASGAPDGKRSTCTIVTLSDFNVVVAWYRAHLPAGWHAKTASDVASLARQASPDNLIKMLTASTQGATPAFDGASVGATPDPGPSVATFSAPDDTPGEVGVMISQQSSKPVVITLSKTQG